VAARRRRFRVGFAGAPIIACSESSGAGIDTGRGALGITTSLAFAIAAGGRMVGVS
jgi:hypothetical protein